MLKFWKKAKSLSDGKVKTRKARLLINDDLTEERTRKKHGKSKSRCLSPREAKRSNTGIKKLKFALGSDGGKLLMDFNAEDITGFETPRDDLRKSAENHWDELFRYHPEQKQILDILMYILKPRMKFIVEFEFIRHPISKNNEDCEYDHPMYHEEYIWHVLNKRRSNYGDPLLAVQIRTREVGKVTCLDPGKYVKIYHKNLTRKNRGPIIEVLQNTFDDRFIWNETESPIKIIWSKIELVRVSAESSSLIG